MRRLDEGIKFYIHIGLEVQNLRAAVPLFRRGSLDVRNPSESERTKALISQATGPNGLAFELLEFGPDSRPTKSHQCVEVASMTKIHCRSGL